MTVEEVRSTPQRRAVLDVLQQAHDHPTAAEVLERVCEVLPGVGAATVYRTLGLLVESGQILELRLGQSAAVRYDRTTEHHDHLVCVECGRVEDVRVRLDQRNVLHPLETQYGYRITSYDLRIHGICTDCEPTDESEGNHHG